MAAQIDQSLDQIIKTNKTKRGGAAGRGRGRGGFRGRGGVGRRTSLSGTRTLRGGIQKRGRGGAAQTRKFTQKFAAGFAAANATTGLGKLLVSNLYFGVTDDDMVQLFSEFGALRKACVHFGGDGNSLGTAEVVYNNRAAAIRAMRKYNQVKLDGRPMKIELVGAAATVKTPQKQRILKAVGAGRGTGGRGAGRGAARGAGRGGRGRGGAQRNGTQKKPATAAELDAQLDAYHKKEPMDTDDKTAKFYPNQKLLA